MPVASWSGWGWAASSSATSRGELSLLRYRQRDRLPGAPPPRPQSRTARPTRTYAASPTVDEVVADVVPHVPQPDHAGIEMRPFDQEDGRFRQLRATILGRRARHGSDPVAGRRAGPGLACARGKDRGRRHVLRLRHHEGGASRPVQASAGQCRNLHVVHCSSSSRDATILRPGPLTAWRSVGDSPPTVRCSGKIVSDRARSSMVACEGGVARWSDYQYVGEVAPHLGRPGELPAERDWSQRAVEEWGMATIRKVTGR